MSIGSLLSSKELLQTYQPLLLVEITFSDGESLNFSTHPLSTTYGGSPEAGSYEYNGIEWLPKILNQNIGAVQAMSDLGIGVSPQVSVVLADADKSIYSIELLKGFLGAQMRLIAIMWDAGNTSTGSFSSDSPGLIKFIGTCGSPQIDENSITITATSLLNMTQFQMPPIAIQPLCGWTFPQTLADRQGANEPHSKCFECGYSPDQAGGVGNYESGTAAFSSCDYSFAACVERLGDSSALIPIERDTSGRLTGRFGGMDWIPNQNSGLQRPYTTGKWEQVINATNDARYGDYVPMVYGIGWLSPLVMGLWSDGNYTDLEVLLCYGNCAEIIHLIVNDEIVAHLVGTSGDDDDPDREAENTIYSAITTTSFINNWWRTINAAIDRSGNPNPNAGWGSKGDPYGSMSAVYVSCLTELVPSNAIPTIQILMSGGSVRQYFTPTDFLDFFGGPSADENSYQPTMSPVWILMDMLIWANFSYTNFDIQSFIDAAAKCETQMYFTREDGTYTNVYAESPGNVPYYRYQVGVVIRQRAAITELVKGILNSMKASLFFDFQTGLLKLIIKETLASQQPSPIVGSNYNIPVPSVTVEGVATNGYLAYAFDETNIRKMDNNQSTLKITQKPNQELSNKVTIQFNDRENGFSPDSATIIDAEAVNRLNQEVTGSFPLTGPQTYDHLRRITNTWFSELYRGNPRLDYQGSFIGDTGGTLTFEFETSIKGVHLTVGQICSLQDIQNGIGVPDPYDYSEGYIQLIRIVSVQPMTNAETFKIVARWHNDNWYQDSYGQVNQPKYTNPQAGSGYMPVSWNPGFDNSQLVNMDLYAGINRNARTMAVFFNTVISDGPPILGIYSQLSVTGVSPINSPASSPRKPKLELKGVAGVGGDYGYDFVDGGLNPSPRSIYPSSATFFFAIAATSSSAFIDLPNPSTGLWNPYANSQYPIGRLSNIVSVPTTIDNAIPEFIVQDWPDDPGGFLLFGGRSPNQLSFQGFSASTEFTIAPSTIASYSEANFGPPDQSTLALRMTISQELVSGILEAKTLTAFVTTLDSVAVTAIGLEMYDGVGLGMIPVGTASVGAYRGKEFSLLGARPNNLGYIPFFNATVLDNDENYLYFKDVGEVIYEAFHSAVQNTDYVNPTLDNRMCLRMMPIYGTDDTGNYIEDTGLVNELNSLGQAARILNATNATPIVVTVDNPALFTAGQFVVGQAVLGNTATNGRFFIASISGSDITLSGSAGNGAYLGEGFLFSQTGGLAPGSLTGHMLYVLYGNGQGSAMIISNNTSTRIYITGNWPFTPDSSGETPFSTSRMVVYSKTPCSDDYFPINASTLTPITMTKFGANQTGGGAAYPFRKPLLIRVASAASTLIQSQSNTDPAKETYFHDYWDFDGSVWIQVPGNMAVGNNQGLPARFPTNAYLQKVTLSIEIPPIGAALIVNVRVGGVLLTTLTIDPSMIAGITGGGALCMTTNSWDPRGEIQGTYLGTDITNQKQLPKWAVMLPTYPITVDVVQAGTTFPGSGMVVTLYYCNK